MIPIMLRDMAPRLLLVLVAALLFYALEPSFHQHGAEVAEIGPALGPVGAAATLANLAGLSMLILLAGFIANDRRRGYYRIFFSHPTQPLAFYGARWGLALGLAMLATALFLFVGQLAAWGEIRGGGSGLLLALLSALIWGGLMAFLSVALPRGDAWAAVFIFLFNYFWMFILSLGAQPLTGSLRRAISFVLPPQAAMEEVYRGLLAGEMVWGAAAFAAGYGVFWLLLAGVLLQIREWP